MFPSQMVILMAIAVAGDSGKKLLTRPMDVTGEYIGYLYDSLVRRGYIMEKGPIKYELTPKGRETLFEFLHQNKSRVKETVRRLKQLGILTGQGTGKLEREAIGVK